MERYLYGFPLSCSRVLVLQATVISRLDAAFCIYLSNFVFPTSLISVCLHILYFLQCP